MESAISSGKTGFMRRESDIYLAPYSYCYSPMFTGVKGKLRDKTREQKTKRCQNLGIFRKVMPKLDSGYVHRNLEPSTSDSEPLVTARRSTILYRNAPQTYKAQMKPIIIVGPA